MIWPRMSRLEREIARLALGGLLTAVAVGAAVAYGIDRAIRKVNDGGRTFHGTPGDPDAAAHRSRGG